MRDEDLTAFDVIRLHDQCSRERCYEDYDNKDAAPCEFFTRGDTGNEDGPMTFAREYMVYPTNYREIPYSDRHMWCIYVIHTGWGWAVKDGGGGQGHTLTKKGEWLYERRGHKQNKSRRFTFEEAMKRAKIAVDKRSIMGLTAAGSVDVVEVGKKVVARNETKLGACALFEHEVKEITKTDIVLDNGEKFPLHLRFHEKGRRFFFKDLSSDGSRRVLGTARAFEVAFPEEK